MQQTVICTSCGAEISEEARFCRKCGQPSARFKTESVTEGTTRLLETPESKRAVGQEFYEQHGSLAQQTQPIPPQANQTMHNLTPASTKQNWLWLSTILFACVALGAIVLLFTTRNRTQTPPTSTPTAAIPEIHRPPQPPQAPQAGAQESGNINPDLIYPGAQVTLKVSDANEGNVLQLRTTDSVEKVVNWYTEKLKPEKIVRVEGAPVVFEAGQLKAVIQPQGSETMILLHQGKDEEP